MNFRLKLLPVFLSILFFFSSFFQICTTVYASDSSHGGGGSSSGTRPSGEEWFYEDGSLGSDKVPLVMSYLVSQAKCLYDGNFSSLISNYFDMKEYMTSDYISISDEPDENGCYNMIFSEDLTKAFKQALIEAAEEQNGFKIYPTIDYNSVPATEFRNAYMYKSFRNLVSESGCIVVNTNYFDDSSYFYAARPFHDITKDSISLVSGSIYGNGIIMQGKFYGTNTWLWYRAPVKRFRVNYVDNDGYSAYHTFTSWEEGEDTTGFEISSGLLDIRATFPTGSIVGNTFFSTDGRKLKVFNSLNALKNYTVGQRGIYFGSGFYDTPTEIKVSLDDLEKYKNTDYDKLLDELKDLIGKETDNEDSLTEEDLEKLVDKLLEGMNNSGGDNSGDNDNTGGNKPGGDNDNPGGIINGISGYLDTILEYLDGILLELGYISNQIEDMTAEAVEEKMDSILLELFSAFGEIGDLLKTKFPFSIPWDIYSMLSFLSSDDPYDMPARAAPMSYFGDDGVISYSSDDGLVIDYNNIAIHNEGTAMLIDDGGSHGGGGASRPGSDGHYDSEGNYHRAPFYEIPFQISKSMGIEGTLIIDLDPFIPLSEISRTMFTCIFIMSLVNLSTKIVDAMGDLFPS